MVGGIHLSIVGRTEAWLENLRVHPEFQGRGIAGRLVKEGEQVARRYGAAVVRTAIPAHDYAAQAVAERAGYHRVLRSVVVSAPLPQGPLHMPYDAPVSVPEPAQAAAVVRFLESTPTVAGWEHLIPLGWRFRRITVDLVKGLIKDRRVTVALRADAAHGRADPRAAVQAEAAALHALRGDAAVLAVLDGAPQGVQAVFAAVVDRGRQADAGRVVVFAPEIRALAPVGVREWVPHPWCPDGLVVVEKRLAA